MSDSVQFEAMAPVETGHTVCPLCTENLVEFDFHFSSETRPIEQSSGHCCLSCAVALLDAMRALTAAELDDVAPSPRLSRPCSKYLN
jgi:hypothetical protein